MTLPTVCVEHLQTLSGQSKIALQVKQYFQTAKKPSLGGVQIIQDILSAANPEANGINKEMLDFMLLFAVENAIQHGGDSGTSKVQATLAQSKNQMVFSIINDQSSPLPDSLTGKVFTKDSHQSVVPEAERDRDRGDKGVAVGYMKGLLERLPEGTTMEWHSTYESATGKPKIVFQLKIPIAETPGKKVRSFWRFGF